MRGNRHGSVCRRSARGSIPASAGKPKRRSTPWEPARVYPRECGETGGAGAGIPAPPGLSPRVRGNRSGIVADRLLPGSIPASAGKPEARATSSHSGRVYPRECGETSCRLPRLHPGSGLSPRVRGNRQPGPWQARWAGSIPASAGKPALYAYYRGSLRVYPRECGETAAKPLLSCSNGGLSPRVRGNRGLDPEVDLRVGSIPASAGKPENSPNRPAMQRVYPRECGETCRDGADLGAGWGLSPRVRGNRIVGHEKPVMAGSIPASAGKPLPAAPSFLNPRVYPRECGETTCWTTLRRMPSGLSPRVRGNQACCAPRCSSRGSIPASAGKPRPIRCGSSTTWVYPRECGETQSVPCSQGREGGLSPRVRGNRRRFRAPPPRAGSIPASAGKPQGVWCGPL